MISKANIKGHPLHPILVIFPVAFFTGTLVFDLLGSVYDRQSFTETGQYLEIAGLGSALVAAIPGFLDFLFVIDRSRRNLDLLSGKSVSTPKTKAIGCGIKWKNS